MIEIADLLTAWDSEIQAELRAAEDAWPETEAAILVAEEAAATARDTLRAVTGALGSTPALPGVVARRVEQLEMAARKAEGQVAFCKGELANLRHKIAAHIEALARLDRGHEALAASRAGHANGDPVSSAPIAFPAGRRAPRSRAAADAA